MDLATLTQKANEAVTAGSDFNKKVKFDFGDVGKLFIDGANGVADNSDADADATVKVDWDDFVKPRLRRNGPDHGLHARQAESAGRHVGCHAAARPDEKAGLTLRLPHRRGNHVMKTGARAKACGARSFSC